MAIPKHIDAQRDFTAGEIDSTAKRRDDDEFMRKGMRQLSNARTLNTGALSQRPGRNALQLHTIVARDEDILMAPGLRYRLSFTSAHLTIYDANGAQVFTEAGRAWTGTTLGQIVYTVYLKQVFITFPGAIPEVLTWDGVSAWSSAPYAEDVTSGGKKLTVFYRISPPNITLLPSGKTGAINITFSANVLVAGHIGTRMRFCGRQFTITGVTDGQHGTATCNETLPSTFTIGFGSDPTGVFFVGDEVEDSVGHAKGIVTQVNGPAANNILVQVLLDDETTFIAFAVGDVIVGTSGSIAATTIGFGNPTAVATWDEQVIDAFHGFPRSVATDQGRLIFLDFPAVPGGIAWSAVGTPTNLSVRSQPSDAFFEIAPGKNRAQYIMPGPESAEIVFCDAGVFYIPISPTNPLKPGSVQFQSISSDGAGTVQPRRVGDVIIFADQGLNQLQSIIATGAYYRPFEIETLTDYHAHLFNNIQCIALPTSVTQFPERYAYVLNGDGTVAVGKYVLDKTGALAGKVGWLPWNGMGLVKWISALNDAILFVTAYTAGATTAFMLEQLDATLYLDASLPVNAIPAALTPPGGKGPLWWLPTATVDLMDGLLPLGPHTTDANGFILPIFPGEDLTSATLRAGFTWTSVWEPFISAAQPGQDVGQRMKKRRSSRLETYVIQSSGFLFRKLYSGPVGPNLPALGAAVSERRIAAYNVDDNPNLAPPLREQAYAYKPLGRSHDPRNAIVKDTPGPLIVAEIAARVSI